jgi:hypothetical protein
LTVIGQRIGVITHTVIVEGVGEDVTFIEADALLHILAEYPADGKVGLFNITDMLFVKDDFAGIRIVGILGGIQHLVATADVVHIRQILAVLLHHRGNAVIDAVGGVVVILDFGNQASP